jgi:hypothetical protein
MAPFYKRWEVSRSRFGDCVVLGFLFVQFLDFLFTYDGVLVWGPGIEANPLVSSAVASIGLGAGLGATKLVAAGCGILLHLCRVHNMVAVLTVLYLAVAIVPWTALFLTL